MWTTVSPCPEEMNMTMQIQMEKILDTCSWDICASHRAGAYTRPVFGST